MPLKLIAPKPGRSSSYRIRGTYLGVYTDRSAGTPDKKTATALLKKREREIERDAASGKKPVTFRDAVMAYLDAGGEDRYLEGPVRILGSKPLSEIDQIAIDQCAAILKPKGSPATRNRHVYTPIAAVLRRAGRTTAIKRPKGAEGKARIHWLRPDEAHRLLDACDAIHPRLRAFCTFLLYTGSRMSEGLRLDWRDVHLTEAFAYSGKTKNGDPRALHLPPVVVAAMANLSPPHTGRVFRFTKTGRLYILLDKAATAAGVVIPDGIAFHIFRHTYGAWMRRYAKLDTSGLVATGAWLDRRSAAIYEHVDVSEEAMKSDLLPTRNSG